MKLQLDIIHLYKVDSREDARVEYMKKEADAKVRQAQRQAQDKLIE